MARKGLPKSIIKKYGISKKAWAVFRGQKSKSSTPRTSKTSRKVKKVARRRYSRKRSRRRGGMTIPLAPIAGLAAGLAIPIQRIIDGDVPLAMRDICRNYTGWDTMNNRWDYEALKNGLLPLIAGAMVHKFVGGAPLNVNKMLAAAKIPFIRI
ncbi:MAG: hypothetical protein ABIH76_03640 [Candidatus Bathyarchaeota archaeon]